MKFIGSKAIETDRLLLKAQTIDEQKRLWEILMMPEVNKYFLTVPPKLREKLKNWEKQKTFYEEDMKHANDNTVFRWSVFLKETGECIGRISCHEAHDENENINNLGIRGVSWIIDPNFQGKGYGTEAARAMIDFMFLECEIEQIVTCAAICNSASWRIMEKLGFERQEKTNMIQYTFIDGLTEDYSYVLTKEKYLSLNPHNKRKC
jgi:ribosomal-protein-alanine N-acetyltransferase